MSHSPPFIESTAAAPRQAVEVEPEVRREVIVTARWSILAGVDLRETIAATTVAGATIELWSDAESPASNGSLARPGLVLTFWRQDDPGDSHSRTILAAFGSAPAVVPALHGDPVAPSADFQLSIHHSFLSLDVIADRPLLRLTHRDQTPARFGASIFCRSILPELLGLRGGQYRLDEVRLDRPRLTRCAVWFDRCRHAV